MTERSGGGGSSGSDGQSGDSGAPGDPSSEQADLRAAGDRIEVLLDQLASLPDRRAGQWAEELVRCLTDLYGVGLARMLATSMHPEAPRGTDLLDLLAEDDLVASLLLVHDLHPLSLRHRVDQALSDLRTSFSEGDVRLVNLDEETSTIRLRIVASGSSPTEAAALERRVRDAVEAALPELEQVQIDRLLPATPVRFSRRSQAGGGANSGSAPEAIEVAGAR
jgi:hypothetical protein